MRRFRAIALALLMVSVATARFQGRYEFDAKVRTATVVVAAVDSLKGCRADYSCDGVNDEVEIEAAINEVVAHGAGGKVYLAEGTYNIHDTIDVTVESTKGLTIEGARLNATILKAHADLSGKAMVSWRPAAAAGYFLYLYNLTLSGNNVGTTSNHGLVVNSGAGAGGNDLHICRVMAINFEGYGFQLDNQWGTKITDCISEYNGLDGLWLRGNQCTIFGCFFAYNRHGIQLYSEVSTTKTVIANSVMFQNEYHGIYLAGTNNIVTGNIIRDNSQDTANTYDGIFAADGTYQAVSNTIVANLISGNSKHRYNINLGAGSDNNIIAGNLCEGAATADIIDGGSGNAIAVNKGGDEETVTAGTVTLNYWGASKLDSSGGAITGTLGSGQYVGQVKTIVMTDASNSSTVSATNHETSDPEVATFDAVDETWVLVWTGTEWATIKATCTF